MSIEQIEKGVQQILVGLKNGKFIKRELQFIITICESIIRETRKLLDKVE